MIIQSLPDTMTKLAQLSDATIYEPAGDQPQKERRVQYQSHSLEECITKVSTPTGKRKILKGHGNNGLSNELPLLPVSGRT